MRRTAIGTLLALPLCGLLLMACGGGGDGGIAPTPVIGVTLSPGAVSVQQGQSGAATVNLTRGGGFTGAVSLASAGAPAGVTIGFSSASVTGASASISIAVASTAAPGAHQVTIQASGTGVSSTSATLTITVTEIPAVSLSVGPSPLSIDPGQVGTATATLTRTNYTGTVTLTASNVPSGMTVSFSPSAITGTTSDISVNPGAVAAAIYVVGITASGAGIENATFSLFVNVRAGSIALSVAPGSISVEQGQVGSATVTISRTLFTGNVTLTPATTAAGLVVAFNPASTAANTASVTVTVGVLVPTGTYVVTLFGAGTGIATASTDLTITVTSSGPGGTVRFTFCAQSGLPLWFAVRNEGGTWQQIAGVAGEYSFTIDPRGTVAYVMPDGVKTRLEVVYGLKNDLIARGMGLCTGGGGTKTLNGSAASIGATDMATISMGGGFASLIGAGGPFQLTGVADGPRDLIGVRQALLGAQFVPNAMIIQRSLDIANGGSVGTIDFAGGVAPATATATIDNLGADQATMAAQFLSKNGTVASVFADMGSAAAQRTWTGVPNGSTLSGDFHLQSVIATPAGNLTGFPFRAITQYTRLVEDRSLTLPAYLTTAPTVSVVGTAPYVTFTSSWAIEVGSPASFWSMVHTPASGSVSSVTISGTVGYFNAGPVTLDLPTFDASFNASWGLQPGGNVTWTFIAAGGSAWSIGTSAQPQNGAISNTAGLRGSYTP